MAMLDNSVLPYLFTGYSIVVTIDNDTKTVDCSTKHFDGVLEALKSGNYAEVRRLIDAAGTLVTFGAGAITITDGVLSFRGEALHGVVIDRILDMQKQGFDITPMTNFLCRLMENPSSTAVAELYQFMEHGGLPITPDGYLLAYKAVRHDYKDYHTGTIDNSIGAIPSMDRNKVDDNRNNTCSRGLHFCSLEYGKGFLRSGGHMMLVKIDPAEIVSIPVDYNFTKGRCWRYEVVGEYTGFDTSNPKEFFDKAVYSFDPDEDEYEEDSYKDEEGEDSYDSYYGVKSV